MYFSNLEKTAIAQVSLRMIAADGKVYSKEHVVTFQIWSKMQITKEHLKEADQMADLTSLSIIASMDSHKKRFVAAFLGVIMAADGDIDEKELALWRLVSSMCNLPTMRLTECPKIIMEFVIE